MLKELAFFWKNDIFQGEWTTMPISHLKSLALWRTKNLKTMKTNKYRKRM